jgi:hypothetical protein
MGKFDVNMHPAKHIAQTQHLDIAHHRAAAVFWCLFLLRQRAAGWVEAAVIPSLYRAASSDRAPRAVPAGVGHGRAWLCHHLDLALRYFAAGAAFKLCFGVPIKFPRHARAHITGSPINDEKFFLLVSIW